VEATASKDSHHAVHRIFRRLVGRAVGRDKQFGADLQAYDEIPDEPPPRPEVCPFPPDEKTLKWLNDVLNVRLKADLLGPRIEDQWKEVEQRAQDANENPPTDTDEVRWMLALAKCVPGDKRTYEDLAAALCDPTLTVPMWVRTNIADRLSKGRPGAPKKNLEQRRASTNKWLAERDASYLRELLSKIYPKLPLRAPDDNNSDDDSVPKLADKIAGDRWRIHAPSLRNYMERGEKSARRLLSRPRTSGE
jgi:hypothetical protein